VFSRLIKLVHYLALIGFVGGTAAALVLADFAGNAPPSLVPVLRLSILAVGESLMLPSLIVLVVSGMLLVVARPRLVRARWVWAKALLALAVVSIVLAVVQPAITRAAALAAEASLGAPASEALRQAFSAEQIGGAGSLLLALIAIVLAIWRPKLGQSTRDSTGDDAA
jgi:hypothetical protein